MRVSLSLYVLNERDHALLAVMHHTIADDWSMGIWWHELNLLYRTATGQPSSALLDLALQYADFAQWQRNWLIGEVLNRQLAYWQEHLSAVPALLPLPPDRPLPPVQTFNGHLESFEIEPRLTAALQRLGRQAKASPFMVLYAAYAVLLSRYSGQEDLVIGTPIANRHHQETEPLIGFFLNTLPLRADLSGDPSFNDLLKRVRQMTLAAYSHQDIPFEQLVNELQIPRNLSHAPLFQVMFVWHNQRSEPVMLGDLQVAPLVLETASAKFDLTLFLEETEGSLRGLIEYNSDLFEQTTIRRMIGHFRTLLAGITADPEQTVQTLPLLSLAERRQLLGKWNETWIPDAEETCLHRLFEAQVERTPDAVAVVFDEQHLTYRALNQRANQLAHALRKRDVGPDVPVGLYVERSLEMNIGLLGILKAGGAYLPLDSAYPPERLAFMLADAGVPVLLTQERLLAGLPDISAHIVCLDKESDHIATHSQNNPAVSVHSANLAYVIYTSGSTGQPKGVAMPHQPLCNLLKWQWQQTTIAQAVRTLQFTPISFDVSCQEIFSTWGEGGFWSCSQSMCAEIRKACCICWQSRISRGFSYRLSPCSIWPRLQYAARTSLRC